MTAQARPPITDSPWFWVLIFSMMALVMLTVLGGKYGRRQSNEERLYQASERIAAGDLGDAASSEATGRRPYSTPEHNLVPLWPLSLLLYVIAFVSWAKLWRSRRHLLMPANHEPAIPKS